MMPMGVLGLPGVLGVELMICKYHDLSEIWNDDYDDVVENMR